VQDPLRPEVAIEAWTTAASLTNGRVFRPENRGDRVRGESMTEKIVWQMLRHYAEAAGFVDIAPHDLRHYAEFRDYAEWMRRKLMAINAIN
jgi:integrase